jgi:hypothetical protein
MVPYAKRLYDPFSRFKLCPVALPVIETERKGLVALMLGNRQAGCRIDPSGNQHNRFFL